MRILGIDPGLTRMGWGVVDATGARSVRLVAVGVLRSSAEMEIADRLAQLAGAFEELVAEHNPQAVALERVFAQHNVRTVMGTAQVSGVVMAHAKRQGLDVALYTPSEVKAAVTGQGRAAKAQVGTMVAHILGLESPPKPADAADALAIAVTHAWRGGSHTAATPAQQQWAASARAARRTH